MEIMEELIVMKAMRSFCFALEVSEHQGVAHKRHHCRVRLVPHVVLLRIESIGALPRKHVSNVVGPRVAKCLPLAVADSVPTAVDPAPLRRPAGTVVKVDAQSWTCGISARSPATKPCDAL